MADLNPADEIKESAFRFKSQWNDGEEFHENENFAGVSKMAVIALIGGILSQAVFINKTFYFVPIVTLLAVIYALWGISKSEGTLTGKGMTLTALFLLLLPMIAQPVSAMIYQRQLIRQAKEFFPLVFQAAQKGETLPLYLFQFPAFAREEVGDEAVFWQTQSQGSLGKMKVSEFLTNSILITLAELGEDAKICYYKTAGTGRNPKTGEDYVSLVYSVTYSNTENQPETFFIMIQGQRGYDSKKGIAQWKWSDVGKKPLEFNFEENSKNQAMNDPS